MGFLAPWFLAGLVGLGLPVYLHLLRRDTTTPRPFSSLMFFEQRLQSSIRHRRLRYLFLLALRLALLLLLVLAFANPYVSRPPASVTSNRLLLIVVDNSFSMRADTRLADAKRMALDQLAHRGASEKAQVMAFGSRLQVMSQTTVDPSELRAAVNAIEPGDGHGDFGQLARGLHTLVETVPTPIELHFFSDLQRTDMAGNFAEMVFPPNVNLILHGVAPASARNWAVTGLTAPGQVWDPKKAHVEAVVAGFGTPAVTRSVSLLVNDHPVATRSVNIPANGTAKVSFATLDVPYGFSRCAVRLDPAPGLADALAADDQRFFAVERADPQPVLFVHEDSDTRSPLYFGAALASAAESAYVLKPVSVSDVADLQPAHYAFVVLSDLFSVPSSFEATLMRYVRTGGNVLVAIGTNTARHGRVPVFGNRVSDAHDYAAQGEHFLTVTQSDATHPSVAGSGSWSDLRVFYAALVDTGDARIVARLSDQTPLLFDQKVGEGRVVFFASGLDNVTNDFPLQPEFVPFVEDTALYLGGAQRSSGARAVDTFFDLRTVQPGALDQSRGIEVVDPDGQRPLSLQAATQAQTILLTRQGFYHMRLANGREVIVGVNPDPRESDLAVLPEEDLALWRGNSTAGSPAATAGMAGGGSAPAKIPFRLWWYVMLAVLALAAAESWLASRYLGTLRDDS